MMARPVMKTSDFDPDTRQVLLFETGLPIHQWTRLSSRLGSMVRSFQFDGNPLDQRRKREGKLGKPQSSCIPPIQVSVKAYLPGLEQTDCIILSTVGMTVMDWHLKFICFNHVLNKVYQSWKFNLHIP